MQEQKKQELADYINQRIKQEQEDTVEWIDRILEASSDEIDDIIRVKNRRRYND